MPFKPKPLPSADMLRQNFRYDPETGAIFPKVIRTSRKPNERCDRINSTGYRAVWLSPLYYYAHRVVWVLHCGTDPPEYIDHINGDRTDNRIANLRAASHSQNLANMPIYSSNVSGYKGVYRRSNGKWGAQINVNCKRIFLGVFETPEDAARVVRAARDTYHGSFARD
jgi:hypothetical protein